MTEPTSSGGGGAHARFAERRAQLQQAGRRRLALLAAVLLLGSASAWLVLLSPVLETRETVLRGVDPADRAAATDVVAAAKGVPLARVDTGEMEGTLERLPGIEAASVHRAWPRTLEVDVRSRVAALAVADGGRVALMDLDGVVFRRVTSVPEGVPQIVAKDGARVSGRGVAAARTMMLALPEELRTKVTDVAVDDADGVSFRIGRTQVAWGDAADADLKVEVMSILLAKTPRTIDVSAPRTPVTTG